MGIAYITGGSGSGKSLALASINNEAYRRGMGDRVLWVEGDSSPKAVALKLSGVEKAIVLIDECSTELLEWLQSANLPNEVRVFVTFNRPA